jgi:hypothetical protein
MDLLSEKLFVLEKVGVSRMSESAFENVPTALDQNVCNVSIPRLA